MLIGMTWVKKSSPLGNRKGHLGSTTKSIFVLCDKWVEYGQVRVDFTKFSAFTLAQLKPNSYDRITNGQVRIELDQIKAESNCSVGVLYSGLIGSDYGLLDSI